MGAAYIIMDGMWGSCGKGLLAGKLAIDNEPDTVVCNFGPNAGHTYIDAEGREYITRQLPTGIVQRGARILIGPDAIINPEILMAELAQFKDLCVIDRLIIHPRAGIVTATDIANESESLKHIASTRKGVGSALARKITRGPATDARVASECAALSGLVVSRTAYDDAIRRSHIVQIESAQGLELSLNHGTSYPTCTSRDITPEAILNGVGVPRRFLAEVCVVLRTFPIRVGNEYDETGREVGNSGPVYSDQREMTWGEVSEFAGRDILERTTVTKKVRRVFSWSDEQFDHMMFKLKPCSLFLNFVNYLGPNIKSLRDIEGENLKFLDYVNRKAEENQSILKWLGFGPGHNDVQQLRSDL